jgi:NAD(P)-dependent dehydrogenase (short-subunit alcohol dehydrogenase family)
MLTAIEMVRRGFTVIASMRNLEKRYCLEQALSKLKIKQDYTSDFISITHLQQKLFLDTPHPLCKIFQLDVTNLDSIETCVQETIKHFGAIDVLVNNAGYGIGGFVEDISLEEIRAQFETNFWGLVTLTKAVIPHMRTRRHGKIINLSSIAGLIGFPAFSAYSASKFAIEGFSESLRFELIPFNVWVSLVEPGTYATDIYSGNMHLARNSQNPESAYYHWGKELLSEILKDVKNIKASPKEVSQLIGDIAETKRPKPRYLIGKDAKIYISLKKFLNSFLFEKIVIQFSGLKPEHLK